MTLAPRSVHVAAVLALLATGGSSAQEAFPARPIQVIVPATAGGPVDTGIRLIEPRLSAVLATPLVLVNRPGASGIVGMSSVATAAPNGYTIGAGINSAFTVVHISGSTVPYRIDDFAVVGNYAADVSVLVTHADAPWKTFEQLIDFTRKNPGKLTYGSAGIGTVSSLSMQSVKAALDLDITAAPFAGGAQLAVAILGKHVDIGMVPYSTGSAMLRERKLLPLVTTAGARPPSMPDTPTLGEIGLPAKGFNLVLGLYAPQATPDAIVNVLANALEQTMKEPSLEAKFATIGLIAQYENPAAARARLVREHKEIVEVGQPTKQVR